MAKPSFSKPNIRFKLSTLLWIVFLAAVLAEALVLFLGLNSGFGKTDNPKMGGVDEVSKVDLPAYEETLEWVEGRESYALPEYTLQSDTLGRENPFLE